MRSILLALLPTSLALPLALPAPAQEACWDRHQDCPQARFEGLSLVIDDLLYVFGGFDTKSITATTRVDVYDPQSDSWSPRADLPTAVTHQGVELDDRTVWLVAGFVGNHPGVATAATWTYDVDLDSWSPGPPLPRALAGGGLVRFDRKLHWFGGVEADRDTDASDHFVLDLDDLGAGWSSLAPMPEARNHLSGVRLGDRIHAIGGQVRHDTAPSDTTHHHAYDPLADSWTAVAPLTMPRSHFEPGTMVYGGRAIIAGGKSSPSGLGALLEVSAYDPVLDAWTNLPPLPEPIIGVAAKVIQGRLYATTGGSQHLEPYAGTYGRPADFTFAGHMRVNCGGPHYADVGGNQWCSDVTFRNGEPFENAQVLDVLGTDDDELYRTHRTSDPSLPTAVNYRIPADDGKYRLVLHFAEILHGSTGYGGPAGGQRVLRVTIEGEGVRNGFDVADEFGVETATTLTFDFDATGAAVDFTIVATTGTPMLAGFELISLPDDAFESFCTSGANSTGVPALLSFKGSASIGAGDLRLYAQPLPTGQFGLFFYSQNETGVAFGNGTRCVDGPIYRLQVHPTDSGLLAHALDYGSLPAGGEILAGATWGFQAWYRDPAAGGASFDSSDGLRLRFTN